MEESQIRQSCTPQAISFRPTPKRNVIQKSKRSQELLSAQECVYGREGTSLIAISPKPVRLGDKKGPESPFHPILYCILRRL